MNKLSRLSVYALFLWLAIACTNEDERGGEDRRKVFLTLKNKLAVTTTKARTPIATAEENYIRSLDAAAHDWLDMSAPETVTKAAEGQKYTFTVKTTMAGYTAQEDDASYRVTTAGGTITIVATASEEMNNLSIATAYDQEFGAGNNWLPVPANPTKTEVVNGHHKYTYQIVIPASEGTDPQYQLHKGTITIKDAGEDIKTYTLWRGASNKPYPTNGGDVPYYTALKKGAYWWAPVNCGAKHVAQNGQADTDGIGNLYQWGRKDPTNHGGGTTAAGPIDPYTSAVADKYYTATSANSYDWLSPKNDGLWQNGLNDPCPTGYCVPTADELKAWGTSGAWGGELLKIKCETGFPQMVLPAAGNRGRSNGSSYSKGTDGYYWSSTPSGTNAANVYFGSATVSALTGYRAYGFSVRCVRK